MPLAEIQNGLVLCLGIIVLLQETNKVPVPMQTLSTNIQYIDVGPRVGLDVTGNRKTGRRKVGGWGMEFLIGVCMSVPRLRFPLSNPRAIAPGRCGKKKTGKKKNKQIAAWN